MAAVPRRSSAEKRCGTARRFFLSGPWKSHLDGTACIDRAQGAGMSPSPLSPPRDRHRSPVLPASDGIRAGERVLETQIVPVKRIARQLPAHSLRKIPAHRRARPAPGRSTATPMRKKRPDNCRKKKIGSWPLSISSPRQSERFGCSELRGGKPRSPCLGHSPYRRACGCQY